VSESPTVRDRTSFRYQVYSYVLQFKPGLLKVCSFHKFNLYRYALGRNFLTVKGPELYSKWVGDSEKAVRVGPVQVAFS
jgi:hypothetical protein